MHFPVPLIFYCVAQPVIFNQAVLAPFGGADDSEVLCVGSTPPVCKANARLVYDTSRTTSREDRKGIHRDANSQENFSAKGRMGIDKCWAGRYDMEGG